MEASCSDENSSGKNFRSLENFSLILMHLVAERERERESDNNKQDIVKMNGVFSAQLMMHSCNLFLHLVQARLPSSFQHWPSWFGKIWLHF